MTNHTMTEREIKQLVGAYYQLMDGYTHLLFMVDSIMAILNDKDLISYEEIGEKVEELTVKLKATKMAESKNEMVNEITTDVEQALKFDSVFGKRKISES